MGKKMKASVGKLQSRQYGLKDAVELVKQTAYAKFDESVDMALRLGVDPKRSDQMVRGTTVLPHGTGKKLRVLVFAKGEKEAVGKLGKVLGPRGLMPNPKAGTVTFEIAKAMAEIRKGRVEYKVEKAGIVHVSIGKVSFEAQRLYENAHSSP